MVRTLDHLLDLLIEAQLDGNVVGSNEPGLDDEARQARGRELGEPYADGREWPGVDLPALLAEAYARGYAMF